MKWRNDYWNPRQPRKTIKRHGTEARKQEFTEIQKQIVLGTVLGDSYINRNPSGGCRLEFTHGEGQLDWMKWKRDQLSFVFNQVKPTQCVNRKGEKFYRLASVQHHYLDDLRSVFYQRGRKIIPKSVIDNMTPLTLAVWYMDDGWYNSNPNSRQASIATNCFPIKDVRYASSVLKERFGLNSSVYIVGNQQPQLTFLRSTIDKFFDIIRPYIHPTMIYKLNHS